MRTIAIIVPLFSAAILPAAATQPSPPAPHCFSAREIREVRQSDPQTFAIRLNDESRYRLELADACPDALYEDRLRVVSRHGWICGGNDEMVESGKRQCAVSGMGKIDARQYAELALASDRNRPSQALERIEVRAKRGRGFGGTTAYCFDTRHLRGWREDGNDIVVEVSPKRSNGHRYYRVEFDGSCPEMVSMDTLQLDSPSGGTAFCGNAGDRALFSRSSGSEEGFARRLIERGLAASAGCSASRVYPMLPEEKSP
jgi:Family of unknown function (DUF6491)